MKIERSIRCLMIDAGTMEHAGSGRQGLDPLRAGHYVARAIRGGRAMCESSVFIRRDGGDVLLAEDVARVVPDDRGYRVITLLGEEHRVTADLVEIDLMAHRIVLRERK
jgi:predicted RNA-binding protein